MKPTPIIWILWGMWPYASMRAYRLFLEIYHQYANGGNHDFPHLLIDNIPVRELTESTESRDLTVSQVRLEYVRLQEAWVNIFLMACNTMHLYLDEIYDSDSDICTHVSLIDTVSDHIVSRQYTRVGILGTMNTIKSHLYDQALRDRWITPIVLTDQEMLQKINRIIQKLIAGTPLISWDHDILIQALHDLERAWAQCIILGCTELPLAYQDISYFLPLLDPLLLSIEKICALYYTHLSSRELISSEKL